MDFQVRFDVALSAHFAQFSDEHIEELQRSLRENDYDLRGTGPNQQYAGISVRMGDFEIYVLRYRWSLIIKSVHQNTFSRRPFVLSSS